MAENTEVMYVHQLTMIQNVKHTCIQCVHSYILASYAW